MACKFSAIFTLSVFFTLYFYKKMDILRDILGPSTEAQMRLLQLYC